MQVIVPAAGVGTRLRPFTNTLPKPLVPVLGQPLLTRTLEQLHAVGIDEVVCVTGHLADRLESTLLRSSPRPALSFVRNPDYATANSIVSLALTRERWTRPFLVIDSDVCFTTALLRRLLAADGDILVVDTSKAPPDMDMRAEIRDGHVAWLAKDLPLERCHGEFFGLSRWTPRGAAALSRSIDRLLTEGHPDVWYEFAIRDAAQELPIDVMPARCDEWAEIDAPADLAAAEDVVARNSRRRR